MMVQYIFDACSLINIIHVDEDEFLLKKISALNFTICKKVFEETSKNAFKKFENTKPYPTERHKIIAKKVDYLRGNIHSDESYLDIESDVYKDFTYLKRNGEYYSVLLSFYLNTFANKHILFITDDLPAKEFFESPLRHSKIGYIEDSIDIIIQIYRHNEEFTKNDLKKTLSSLYSEYAVDFCLIEKEIMEAVIPAKQIRDKDILLKLTEIRNAFAKKNLEIIFKIYDEVCNDTQKYSMLNKIFLRHISFFRKRVPPNYLFKIEEYIDFVDTKPFYKFIEC